MNTRTIQPHLTGKGLIIGLQRVDGLSVSDFLIQVACQEIEGKITMNKAHAMINEHYEQIYSNQSPLEKN